MDMAEACSKEPRGEEAPKVTSGLATRNPMCGVESLDLHCSSSRQVFTLVSNVEAAKAKLVVVE